MGTENEGGSPREGVDVTFVGGKAVEQSEQLDSSLPTDEREAAKDAVRKAIEAAGRDSAEDAKSSRAKDPFKPAGTTPDRGSDGKFLPKDEKGASKTESDEEEKLDPAKASVKQLLKAREKVASIKREATDEISQQRQAFAREQEQFRQHQAQFQQQAAQLARQQQALNELTRDPARAIRQLGMDPEQYILQLAQEGTPEGAQARKQREVDQQLAEIKHWREQQARQAEQQQYQAHVAHIAQARDTAIKEFTSLGLQEEKYPLTSTFFKGNERALLAWGDLAAEEYRHLSGGNEGSYADILDYIEDQLAERSNHWYTKRNGQKVVQEQPKERPSKSKGMSLNPDASGERRALSPRALDFKDDAERLAAAKDAVAVALAASQNER